MKGMVETAGLGEIIQEVRTKRMKERTWVLPTLWGLGWGTEMEESSKTCE